MGEPCPTRGLENVRGLEGKTRPDTGEPSDFHHLPALGGRGKGSGRRKSGSSQLNALQQSSCLTGNGKKSLEKRALLWEKPLT